MSNQEIPNSTNLKKIAEIVDQAPLGSDLFHLLNILTYSHDPQKTPLTREGLVRKMANWVYYSCFGEHTDYSKIGAKGSGKFYIALNYDVVASEVNNQLSREARYAYERRLDSGIPDTLGNADSDWEQARGRALLTIERHFSLFDD